MASPYLKTRMHEKRWTRMDSATRLLPLQDWRWLVTRPITDEKPMAQRKMRQAPQQIESVPAFNALADCNSERGPRARHLVSSVA
jgi:hypothetical protein